MFILKASAVPGHAGLESPDGVGDEIARQIGEPVALAAAWPTGARYRIPEAYEQDARLGDLIAAHGGPVVSGRFREALEPLVEKEHVELLPVAILDLSGKAVAGTFCLLRVIHVEDIVDVEASGGKLNDVDKVSLIRWKKLVLRPSTSAILRARGLRGVAVVRDDVAASLKAIQPPLVGLGLVPSGSYRGT